MLDNLWGQKRSADGCCCGKISGAKLSAFLRFLDALDTASTLGFVVAQGYARFWRKNND
jgi:hypothetical protein